MKSHGRVDRLSSVSSSVSSRRFGDFITSPSGRNATSWTPRVRRRETTHAYARRTTPSRVRTNCTRAPQQSVNSSDAGRVWRSIFGPSVAAVYRFVVFRFRYRVRDSRSVDQRWTIIVRPTGPTVRLRRSPASTWSSTPRKSIIARRLIGTLKVKNTVFVSFTTSRRRHRQSFVRTE